MLCIGTVCARHESVTALHASRAAVPRDQSRLLTDTGTVASDAWVMSYDLALMLAAANRNMHGHVQSLTFR